MNSKFRGEIKTLLAVVFSFLFIFIQINLNVYAQTSSDTPLEGSTQTQVIQDYLAGQLCDSSGISTDHSAAEAYNRCRDDLSDQALSILNTCGEAQFTSQWFNCANGTTDGSGGGSDSGGSTEPTSTPLASNSQSDALHSADTAGSGGLFNYIKVVLIVFSAAAGLAIVGSLVVAGVQYATAGENSGSISKAKERIVYTLMALVLFLMLFSIVNWLVPGSQII